MGWSRRIGTDKRAFASYSRMVGNPEVILSPRVVLRSASQPL